MKLVTNEEFLREESELHSMVIDTILCRMLVFIAVGTDGSVVYTVFHIGEANTTGDTLMRDIVANILPLAVRNKEEYNYTEGSKVVCIPGEHADKVYSLLNRYYGSVV